MSDRQLLRSIDRLARALALVGTVSAIACWTATPAIAQTAYNFAVLSDNPNFYWNFNEAGAANAIDSVRQQTNDQLVSIGGATRGAGISANLGNTAVFNGGNSFAAASLADVQMQGAWAIEMWAKADGSLAGSRQDYLLNAGGANVNVGGNNPAVIWDFGVNGDNNFGLCCTGNRTDTAPGTPQITDNDWHHYVFTFYGNGAGFGVADRVDFAVDGVVQTINRNGFSSGFDLNNALVVGAAFGNGTNGLQGQIDELAFYDLSNLSTAQVAARTQDIANHFSAATQSADTELFLVDPSQITYNYTPGSVQPNPNNNRNDPLAGTLGGGKLINGVIASTNNGANLSDGSTVGYNDPLGFPNDNGQPHPGIVFNLGDAMAVEEIWIDYIGANSAAGVAAPDRVDIEFSDDGTTWSGLQSFTDFNDLSLINGIFWDRRLVADVGGIDAEFVRLNFFNNQEWTFLSEVQFVASPQAVPESSTIVLWSTLGMGMLGVVVWRRRRK